MEKVLMPVLLLGLGFMIGGLTTSYWNEVVHHNAPCGGIFWGTMQSPPTYCDKTPFHGKWAEKIYP